jgi:CheY-like chemotaxis protein
MENLTFLIALSSLAISVIILKKVAHLEKLHGPTENNDNFSDTEDDDDDSDDLYEEAKSIVIAAKKCSTSLLQRKLRIGYGRAARLEDMLEENGIVSEAGDAKPREVLASRNSKFRIALVQSDPYITDLLKRNFQEAGLYVYARNDANGEFAESMTREKPNLIVLDVLMPGRMGFEAIELLKKNQDTKNIPVFFLSNLGDEQEINQGINLGAKDYLITAFFTPEELVQTCIEYLENPDSYATRYAAAMEISQSPELDLDKPEKERDKIKSKIFEKHGIEFSTDS